MGDVKWLCESEKSGVKHPESHRNIGYKQQPGFHDVHDSNRRNEVALSQNDFASFSS